MDLDEINLESLKDDLIDYFGTASRYFQIAGANIIEVEECSPEELICLAINNNFDLAKYFKKRLK